MMKRISWILLLITIIAGLTLVSCSSDSADNSSKKYLVATDATWAPFEYVNDATKELEGFDIDFFNAVAEKGDFEFEYVNVAFDPLLAGVAQGQYDAAISSITITEERKKDMLFSDPYFEAGQIVVVKIDNNTIKGYDTLSGNVGAQIGTTGAMEVEDSNATLKTYDDIGLAFQDLMNGQIEAVVCDNPVAMGYVGKNSDKLKYVGSVFTEENYGIAIAKGNTELQAKINKGIAAVKAAGLDAEYAQKWLEK